MKVLTTAAQINDELIRLIEECSTCQVAVPWALVGFDAFELLAANPSKINRVVVGTHFFQMGEDIKEFGYKDSTKTMLSDILPKGGKRFRFAYQYDLGDSWEHEVVFEGCPKAEAGRQYPICLEGERACPPEDCGGVGGYADFLDPIGNKKHEQHQELLEWVGGRFDPEEFDAAAATKSMKKGLPDWRSMR